MATQNYGAISSMPIDAKNESKDITILPQPEPIGDTQQLKITEKTISESPEIIAFLDFIPVYNDDGDLNKVGQFFQAKQDSKLISANASIVSILNASISSDLALSANDTKSEINNFCNDFASNFNDLILSILKIKERLDFRSSFDNSTLKLMELSAEDISSIDNINYIVKDNKNDDVGNWSSTKTWIQSCLELKESFKNGQINRIISHNINNNNINDNDPYSIVFSNSIDTKKFNFINVKNRTAQTEQSFIPGFSEIKNTDIDVIEKIFQKKYFEQPGLPNFTDETIARYAMVLCKEFVFSTKMNKDILLEYGYQQNTDGTNNVNVWDYLFGNFVGSDITDIPISPVGDGKSMISLSQSIESDGTEVLPFENYYIRDDVGTKRTNTTITPGIFYYIESIIAEAFNADFNTARLDPYILKLKRTIKMLDMLRNDLAFSTDVVPMLRPSVKSLSSVIDELPALSSALMGQTGKSILTSPLSFVGRQGVSGSNAGEVISNSKITAIKPNINEYFSKTLSNPILLLRSLEEKILGDSDLLVRVDGPRSLSNVGIATPNKTKAVDISGALISTAINNPALMAVLFLNRINNNTDTATAVLNQLQKPISGLGSSKDVAAEKCKITFDQLLVALSSTSHPSGKILQNITKYILSLSSYLDSTLFIKASSVASNIRSVDVKTIYAGIEKTIYLSAIFELCCQMVHSAGGFEKILGFCSVPGGDGQILDGQIDSVYEGSYFVVDLFGSPYSEFKNTLPFDSSIKSSEDLLYDYNKALLQKTNRFYAFIFSLQKELESIRELLLSNKEFSKFKNFLNVANDIINDPTVMGNLLIEEQMFLIQSKLFDFKKRASNSYSSPIKQSIPYFLSLKHNSIDDFLPIEDVHLVSWNLFLKKFFKNASYREQSGFNKKIISIGIPSGLYKRTLSLINATKLNNKKLKNKLIKINLYRINELNKETYHPKSYIFDLSKYQTRVLQNFIDSGFSISGNQSINLTLTPNDLTPYIPTLKPAPEQFDSFRLTIDQSTSFNDTTFLNPEEKTQIIENHSISFLMEEYIRYISNNPFDEQRYHKYDNISSKKRSDVATSHFSNNQSMQDFLVEESFLTDVKSLKKSLITPRKFDRVFHIIFDPDDFKRIDDSSPASPVMPGKITLDKYYTDIEIYE